MKTVTIYTTPWCGYCHRAKALLTHLQIAFHEIDVSNAPDKRQWLVEVTGQRTVPQIFIAEESIGGCDELHDLHHSGLLKQRLQDSP